MIIVFSSLFFSIILKILNIIQFTVVFKIINHYMIFIIDQMSDADLNFTFLCLKIFLNGKKTFSITS